MMNSCPYWGGVVRLIDWIYPVGSVLAFANSVNPNNIYRSQTWEKVAQGRVLMGADETHKAGETAEAGLPNITGASRPAIRSGGYPLIVDNVSGALYKNNENGYQASNVTVNTNSAYKGTWLKLDASRSNPIYGNSDTVQPPAYFINYWQRTA